MNPTLPGPWQRWWPFAIVAVAYGVVALQQIHLPGVYMDAVNPDYMAVRLLNRRHEQVLPWLLPGNYLDGRYPILISFYHGSQQMWLGLPFFWLFGTTVTGLRLTHAMFALGVLAAMYAFLGRNGSSLGRPRSPAWRSRSIRRFRMRSAPKATSRSRPSRGCS